MSIASTLALLSSFEVADKTGTSSRGSRLRLVRSMSDGTVLSWRTSRYRLERWTTDGEDVQVLERNPEWFPSEAAPVTSPRPVIKAVSQDSEGLLWVFVYVPVPEWLEGIPPEARVGVSDMPVEAIANEKVFDTTVEVLDPVAGRVIARTTLDAYVVSALPGGRVAIYGTSEQELPFVRIVRLELER